MNPLSFLQHHPVFTTREFATACGVSISSASRQLGRLHDQNILQCATRGIWAQPALRSFSPLLATPFLLGNEQGYVSFLTAMHHHGLISQIPRAVQLATTGHTRTLESPIGPYEFIRLRPKMMTSGIVVSETEPAYSIANREKALLDTLYISTRKGRRFVSLPEIAVEDLNRDELGRLYEEQITAHAPREAVRKKMLRLGINID